MTKQAFISAVSYDQDNDEIHVIITDVNKQKIALLSIEHHVNKIVTVLEVVDAEKVDNLPFMNNSVLIAAIISTLTKHTTEETDIALVIDIDEPILIELF